ncbi:23636_t:CDS:2, partial [Dentiscutata erythropus]
VLNIKDTCNNLNPKTPNKINEDKPNPQSKDNLYSEKTKTTKLIKTDKSETTTISYTEEHQEIMNSLLFKELNKPQKKEDLENFDRYLIILGLLAFAEQKSEDYKH